MRSTTIIVSALLLRTAAAIAEGPFGVTIGQSISTLPGCVEANKGHPGGYVCKSLPKSHPAFENFVLFATKESGVCKVTAVSVEIPDEGNGSYTRAKVDEIAGQVASIYGPWSKRYDFLHVGSVFKDDSDFLLALNRKERTYSYLWMQEQTEEKNGVRAIAVKAEALTNHKGVVSLQFEFSNFPLCKESMERAQASAF